MYVRVSHVSAPARQRQTHVHLLYLAIKRFWLMTEQEINLVYWINATWRLFIKSVSLHEQPKSCCLPKIAEQCGFVLHPGDLLTDLFCHYCEGSALQNSSIICTWDDEPYFILIQVFIAVIQGKDHLPVTLRSHISLPHMHKHMYTVYLSVSYRSECPKCGVCPTSTLPYWRHPVHSLVTLLSSSPKAPHQGRTHIHIPLTL